MPLTAKRDKMPAISPGVYVGVCYGIFDLGTQHSEMFDKDIHQVLICWELPDERIDVKKDGMTQDMPRAISERYTLSLGKRAKLRQHLECWRGQGFSIQELEGFDLKNVLGSACQLQVIHNDNGYAKIQGIMSMSKGVVTPHLENKPQWFSFEEGMTIAENTPEWVKEEIMKSREWDTGSAEQPPPEPQDQGQSDPESDNVPF